MSSNLFFSLSPTQVPGAMCPGVNLLNACLQQLRDKLANLAQAVPKVRMLAFRISLRLEYEPELAACFRAVSETERKSTLCGILELRLRRD